MADTTERVPAPPRRRTLSLRERLTPVLISVVSTVVVFGAVAYLVANAEGWPQIQRQFFSFEAMQEAFPRVLRGFWLNVRIWAIALVANLLLGLMVAIMRSITGPVAAPLRVAAIVFIDLLRGIPSILLVLLFGFGVPALQVLPGGRLFWGTVALVLGYGAYTAEVYRSGMEAVPDGQRAASKALGLSQWQTMRYAIVPQGIRNALPALLNLAVALQKDVALLSVIGVNEAVREANIFTARTFNYSSLIVAALLFLLASVPLARLTDAYARRDQERRLQRTL